MAFKLVELYIKEASKTKEKREMGLDTVLNAYFYALLRITRKQKEMHAISKAVDKDLTNVPAPSSKGTKQKEAFEFE